MMDSLIYIFDLFMHVDKHLQSVVDQYGLLSYAILFAVIFLETGVVVTPFLPGDSLLFAAGALAGAGVFDIKWVLVLLVIAAVLGDTVNYWIGRKVGPKVFTEGSRFFKQEHLVRTQQFYDRHGGKTIVLARFVPIVRTFAPFVAGIGKMNYAQFWFYNATGGLVWVCGFGILGYFCGNIPIVQKNFGLVVIAIILLSVVPIVVEFWKARKAKPVS